MEPAELKAMLQDETKNQGADLFGVTRTALLEGLPLLPENLAVHYRTAISMAVKLPTGVFESIQDCPTPIYANTYQAANRLLDKIAISIAKWLEDRGHLSLPVPASQILDKKNFFGAISHKAVARMAGLGWQGKSLLLVTPIYGPRVRLVTVLTAAELPVDEPMKNRCGNCRECEKACPSGAIKGVSTQTHYPEREDALYFDRCVAKTYAFANLPHIGAPICGICIRVCPFGRKPAAKKRV